jgi:hypothetical protein
MCLPRVYLGGKLEANMDRQILKQFQKIPGVGKSISKDLYTLGYRSIDDLKDRDPEMMYERLCMQEGKHLDRCLLYTFRCVVYFASNKKHEQEKLKWWNWTDEAIGRVYD